METTVPKGLEINITAERLDEGTVEERATFGMLTIETAHQCMTQGIDFFVNGYRNGPLVSGYYVAEWLAWNWWRLRWEPRSAISDWAFAHKMTSIGEGYVWPNIDIWSDGVRTMLISTPSQPNTKPFRFVGAFPTVVPSGMFQGAVDEFLPQVIGRLRSNEIAETNLDRIWRDVLTERADPEIAKRRRLEALMGRDPDAVDDQAVEALIHDADRLGEEAIDEVAAELARIKSEEYGLLSAESLQRIAAEVGSEASVRDSVILRSDYVLPRPIDVPAWKLGSVAAISLRQQENLGVEVITNRKLATMVGVRATVIASQPALNTGPSFALDDERHVMSRVVLPARYTTSRRFALARLLGDRLMYRAGALHPAMHTYTYRQKAQRSFAAEFLSPFEAVDQMLDEDFSIENQQAIADHFLVSPMLINTLLKNHGRLDRDASDEDFYATAS